MHKVDDLKRTLRVCYIQTLFGLLATVVVLFPTCANSTEVRIATFNTASDEKTKPESVAKTMELVKGVDVWGLQEVEGKENLELFLAAAEKSGHGEWKHFQSTSGKSTNPDFRPDYLAILYRSDLFRMLETVEVHAIASNPDKQESKYGRHSPNLRGALFLRLLHRQSRTEFLIGNVHLKCCGDGVDTREHQSRLLADWISRTSVPVILLGDTNIPITPKLQAIDVDSEAFQHLIGDNLLRWIAPINPIKTHCNEDYNSMLDQIYHSPDFLDDNAKVEIQFDDKSYCQPGFSDHRPVVATFNFPSSR